MRGNGLSGHLPPQWLSAPAGGKAEEFDRVDHFRCRDAEAGVRDERYRPSQTARLRRNVAEDPAGSLQFEEIGVAVLQELVPPAGERTARSPTVARSMSSPITRTTGG
jgi:hypothetical protein